jgi:hypothetical protein
MNLVQQYLIEIIRKNYRKLLIYPIEQTMIKQVNVRQVHHSSKERIMWKLKLENEVSLDYLQQVDRENHFSIIIHFIFKGTNAKVYMRLHDKNGQVSEPIELHKSTNHRNKFERGQTDGFDIGMCIQKIDS